MTERSASIGHLLIREGELANADLRDGYDLCIGVSSWESRATVTFETLPPKTSRWEVWTFSTTDPDRAKAKQDCFERLSSLRSETVELFQLAGSLQYEQNFQIIEHHFRALSRQNGGPLDVLLDMTCMPKKYILFMLGMAFRNEYVRAIDFLYTEGSYRAPIDANPPATMSWSSSEGEWSSVQVPYLEANNFIPDARGLIVSLGAEISASVPFIERYEPTRIALVSVEDDATRIDTDAIETERRLLRELEALPITTAHTAPLEAVLSVATLCESFCREQAEMAVTGLAIGSKPHALALGLVALSIPNLEIVCRLPSRYLSGDVVSTGRVFLYRVEDRFEPR